jgi:hypothetical protein
MIGRTPKPEGITRPAPPPAPPKRAERSRRERDRLLEKQRDHLAARVELLELRHGQKVNQLLAAIGEAEAAFRELEQEQADNETYRAEVLELLDVLARIRQAGGFPLGMALVDQVADQAVDLETFERRHALAVLENERLQNQVRELQASNTRELELRRAALLELRRLRRDREPCLGELEYRGLK